MNSGQSHIMIFLKAPEPGKVKTRLAKFIGAEAACEAYKRLVAWQLSQIPNEIPVTVFFDPPDEEGAISNWIGNESFRYLPQASGDLGERIFQGFTQTFEYSGSAIAIGGDCPYLNSLLLLQTTELLKRNDAVIGPAADGGYYLLGLSKKPTWELFSGINWSTESVLSQTQQKLTEAHFSFVELQEKEDVDDIDSWKRAEAFMNSI